MSRVLLVANVAKEHVLKFHQPTIREMKNRGWSVDVACAGDEDIPGCDRQFRMKWKRSPLTKTTLGEIARLRRIIREGEYDLIYCHTPMGGLASRLASVGARRRGTRVIYCVHGFHFYDGAPLMNWLVYYPAERFLARFTDGIITINREDYQRAIARFPGRLNIYLIPGMGVDPQRMVLEDRTVARADCRRELDIPDDAPVMLYVAELTDNKNQKMLIDVLGCLQEKGVHAYLILAGPDQMEGVYEEYAGQRGLAEWCRFLGWRDDVARLLAAADIYTASSIREGMTVNLIEARLAGLPVLATDNRGHRMALEDCDDGTIVAVHDAGSMADCIIEHLHNWSSHRTDRLRRDHDQKNLEQYDANTIASRIVDILESEL